MVFPQMRSGRSSESAVGNPYPLCRNSPRSQRHQWLVFIMRRERSLDPENGRKKELTVAWSILVRGHLRAAQHTSKLSNRRLKTV